MAGVVLDAEDTAAEPGDDASTAPDDPPQSTHGDATQDGEDQPQDDEGLGIDPLVVLRSGPAAVGTTWLAAAGTWVGLDGQTLEPGAVPPPLHLDAEVEVSDPEPARAIGCIVRLVAPVDADLQVDGILTAELVIVEPDAAPVRTPIDEVVLDLLLAPGDTWELGLVIPEDTAFDVAPRPDATIRCEGRFDRS